MTAITAVWSESSCAFPKNGTATGSRRERSSNGGHARQKRSYLHNQGEFQLQNCTVGTVHDSDHEGVVRIFVGHSYHSNELIILYYIILYYITRHNFSYTRSVTIV